MRAIRSLTFFHAVINVNCSVNAPCPGLKFKNINLTVTPGDTPVFTCENAPGLTCKCIALNLLCLYLVLIIMPSSNM